MSHRLVLGTHNEGKVRELRRMLSDLAWIVEGLPDDTPEYEETGDTFADNARGKALYYAERTAAPTLGEDSGLVVDALGGEPGVRSARYIDPEMEQPARNRAVLERLEGVPEDRRGARFRCHLTLAHDGAIVHETTGSCEGRIATTTRGRGGFGYDPIFLVEELGRTFAELDPEDKSAVSHRGGAVREMVRFLAGWSP